MNKLAALSCLLATAVASHAQSLHHYVFFAHERKRITESSFLNTSALEGAQLKYSWRELEPQKDGYDLGAIRDDLKSLSEHHKRLWIQLQDVSFDPESKLVPDYLLNEPTYHGGADQQFDFVGDDEATAKPAGWVARRWDPAVRERFARLLNALGGAFDGKIEGINLPETAVDFGETGKHWPSGFTPSGYRDAIIEDMAAVKKAFPKSVAMQYGNFMPTIKEDADDQTALRSVYEAAVKYDVAMGGPDLMPYRRGMLRYSYPLLHEFSPKIVTGIAVQEGNYSHKNPMTGERVSVDEMTAYARDYLGVKYMFWCTEEPYYTRDVVTRLKAIAIQP